jgi:hypothetical protein
MEVSVKIEPIKVLVYPEEKYADTIVISEPTLKLIDKGLIVRIALLSSAGENLFDRYLELTNEELIVWTNSDEQLVNIILNKLNLTKVANED